MHTDLHESLTLNFQNNREVSTNVNDFFFLQKTKSLDGARLLNNSRKAEIKILRKKHTFYQPRILFLEYSSIARVKYFLIKDLRKLILSYMFFRKSSNKSKE